jgi:cell division protein FtsL
MPTLFELVVAWTVLTVALVILLIYRGTLTMQEDDQLFLGESEAHMAREQNEIISKVNKLGPFVKILGTASAVLVLAIAGLAVYQQMTAAQ